MINLSLKEKMQKLLAITSAAGISLLTTGCFDYEKQQEDVAVKPVGYSSDVDSTTVTKEDSTSEFNSNIVTRMRKPAETALHVVVTDPPKDNELDENNNIVNETTTVANDLVLGTNVFTNNDVKVTTAKEDKNYNNDTDVVYSTTKATKPVTKTTTKVTIKTTKATKATTKATTTTTTTTTAAPVTEPPVTEAPEISDFSSGDDTSTVNEHSIYDICNKKNASKYFARLMELDITGDSAGFYEVNLGYGPTTLYHECIFTVYVLNSSYYVNDSVVQGLFKSFSKDEFSNDRRFLGMIKYAQDLHGSDIDYSKYTIDSSVGDFLNSADDAYRNGCFDEFINDKVVNGNAGQNILSNPGVMAILSSYSYSNCFSYEQIDASLDQLIDHICEITYGAGYSR